MDDFAQVIFQNAVIKEQLAQKLYLSMAQKAKSEKIKRLFTKLAEEEILHEKLLSKFELNEPHYCKHLIDHFTFLFRYIISI